MQRINIEWNKPIVPKSQSINGIVRIFEGHSAMEMRETSNCSIEVSSACSDLQVNFMRTSGRKFLPPEMASEKIRNTISALAEAYLRGLNCDTDVYYYTEID